MPTRLCSASLHRSARTQPAPDPLSQSHLLYSRLLQHLLMGWPPTTHRGERTLPQNCRQEGGTAAVSLAGLATAKILHQPAAAWAAAGDGSAAQASCIAVPQGNIRGGRAARCALTAALQATVVRSAAALLPISGCIDRRQRPGRPRWHAQCIVLGNAHTTVKTAPRELKK